MLKGFNLPRKCIKFFAGMDCKAVKIWLFGPKRNLLYRFVAQASAQGAQGFN